METRSFSDISYEQFLNEDRLMGSRCRPCCALSVPPPPVWARCCASDMEWVDTGGQGKLAAFTSIAVGPPFMVQEGYSRERPYVSGVVELEEGARVVARIEGVDGSRPESIRVGTPLRVEFLHRRDGDSIATFLAFRPE